jgi:DNA-binding protein HU-beta
MNKNELIQGAAERSGLTQAQVRKSLDAILGIVGESLDNGVGVVIPDFGKLFLVRSAARKVKLPNGQWTFVPVKERIKFKAFSNIRNYSAKY